jgi:hypothetical protein
MNFTFILQKEEIKLRHWQVSLQIHFHKGKYESKSWPDWGAALQVEKLLLKSGNSESCHEHFAGRSKLFCLEYQLWRANPFCPDFASYERVPQESWVPLNRNQKRLHREILHIFLMVTRRTKFDTSPWFGLMHPYYQYLWGRKVVKILYDYSNNIIVHSFLLPQPKGQKPEKLAYFGQWRGV